MSTLLPFRDQRLPPVPTAASTYHHHPIVFIERQSKHIQRKLQTLIDAQSEGLLAGLGQAQPDDTSDTSSTHLSSQANRPLSSTHSSRNPPSKKIGLRAAREGIFQSIYDLLKLREAERDILSSQSDERDNALHEIEDFSSRRSGLEKAIASIHSNRDSQRAKALKEDAHSLETDIQELENRLFEMKARHRYLVGEISSIENSVDAKLSSYNESLSLLQSDIQTYLRDPPVRPLTQRAGASTFSSLNTKRRTLQIAQEYWTQEQQDIQRRQEEVDAEILALEEGGGVWKLAVTDISLFEKKLRVYIRRSMQLDAQAATGASIGDSKDEVAASVSQDLEEVTQRLRSYLEQAEDKDWKLLVCCISAELEALHEARGLLLSAFGKPILDEPTSNSQSRQTIIGPSNDHTTEHEAELPLKNDDPEPPADFLKDGESHNTDSASRSEDDEPDPSWLLETN